MRVKDASNDEVWKWRCLFRSQFVEWCACCNIARVEWCVPVQGRVGVFACLLHLTWWPFMVDMLREVAQIATLLHELH